MGRGVPSEGLSVLFKLPEQWREGQLLLNANGTPEGGNTFLLRCQPAALHTHSTSHGPSSGYFPSRAFCQFPATFPPTQQVTDTVHNNVPQPMVPALHTEDRWLVNELMPEVAAWRWRQPCEVLIRSDLLCSERSLSSALLSRLHAIYHTTY